MDRHEGRSFTDVAVSEAAARRTHLDLILKARAEDGRLHLTSRLLGQAPDGSLIIDVPRARGRKVFVPAGAELEMAFPVGRFLLQGPVKVIGHCQFRLHPTRRVDGLRVSLPSRLTPADRRFQPREVLPDDAQVPAWVWAADELASPPAPPGRTGRLVNRSPGGLGLRLDRQPSLPAGAEVIVRLHAQTQDAEELRIYRARLMHCTAMDGGGWLAGLGDLEEILAGHAPAIAEALAAAAEHAYACGAAESPPSDGR